jgi:putative NADH-flavin reductase
MYNPTMNLLVFGSTGATGRLIVEQALSQGHNVTAYGRNATILGINDPHFTFVQGDALDKTQVDRAMQGQDAVISALGGSKHHGPIPESQQLYHATQIIVDSMIRHHIKRLVYITAWGVGDSRNKVPPFFRYVLVPIIVKREYADKEMQESIIRQTGLDWTILRPVILTNGPRSGKHQLTDTVNRLFMSRVSRADVADVALLVVNDPSYARRAVFVR